MIVAMPRTAGERQALWDAATDTSSPVTAAQRDLMFSALLAGDLAYIFGYLPAGDLPRPPASAAKLPRVELRLLLDDDDLEPHPALVASQEVTVADLMTVAYVRGWLSETRVFGPAVEAGR